MTSRAAIVGTVGVPARYGGFETLAQALAEQIAPSDMALTIYCQKNKYSPSERTPDFHGHARVFVPLPANGMASMAYDAVSILDAILRRRCRIILCLGASGALVFPLVRLLFPGTRLIFNLDGMESRRARWAGPAKTLLKVLEWLGVKLAHTVVSDNRVIRSLVRRRYGRDSVVIAYGGDNAVPGNEELALENFDPPQDYALAISRIVPENNVHLVLQAFARTHAPLVYVGNWEASDYGRALRAHHAQDTNLHLLDPIYDKRQLDFLRRRAIACVHGHSVGGTNPALVEAIYWAPQILAFDCGFNRATLANGYCYWKTSEALQKLVLDLKDNCILAPADRIALQKRYRWRHITQQYLKSIRDLLPGQQNVEM